MGETSNSKGSCSASSKPSRATVATKSLSWAVDLALIGLAGLSHHQASSRALTPVDASAAEEAPRADHGSPSRHFVRCGAVFLADEGDAECDITPGSGGSEYSQLGSFSCIFGSSIVTT